MYDEESIALVLRQRFTFPKTEPAVFTFSKLSPYMHRLYFLLRDFYWRLKIACLGDEQLRQVRQYFQANGDNTLRLDYPLDENSIVFDVGGFEGDFASKIYDKYKCRIYVFEPVKEFCLQMANRFEGNPKITIFNYGLSGKDATLNLSGKGDETSFLRETEKRDLTAQVRSIGSVFSGLNLSRIDLMKVNIEGGEFDLIPALVSTGVVNHIGNLQVQFHQFVPNAHLLRKEMREALARTHEEDWCFTFVWESWRHRALKTTPR